MRLYAERGYEQTTVADIASEAGLTARTFFRHFADKREVLFAGSEILLERMVEALDAAPPGQGPMRAVAAALDAAAVMLGRDPSFSRRRQSLIDASAELRERELIKMATIGAALADGLRRCEFRPPTRAWRPRPGSPCSGWPGSNGWPARPRRTWPGSCARRWSGSRR
jgi:AcrR family transcriptional regulator